MATLLRSPQGLSTAWRPKSSPTCELMWWVQVRPSSGESSMSAYASACSPVTWNPSFSGYTPTLFHLRLHAISSRCSLLQTEFCPPISYMGALTLDAPSFGEKEGLKVKWGHGVGPSCDRTGVLLRKGRHQSFLSSPCEHAMGRWLSAGPERVSPEIRLAGTSIFTLQRANLCSLSPPGCFIMLQQPKQAADTFCIFPVTFSQGSSQMPPILGTRPPSLPDAPPPPLGPCAPSAEERNSSMGPCLGAQWALHSLRIQTGSLPMLRN